MLANNPVRFSSNRGWFTRLRRPSFECSFRHTIPVSELLSRPLHVQREVPAVTTVGRQRPCQVSYSVPLRQTKPQIPISRVGEVSGEASRLNGPSPVEHGVGKMDVVVPARQPTQFHRGRGRMVFCQVVLQVGRENLRKSAFLFPTLRHPVAIRMDQPS